MPQTKYTALFNDSDGETATSTYYLDGNQTDPNGAAVEAGRAALQGLSDAPLTRHALFPIDGTTYGTADAGDFATTSDKLLIEGLSANNQPMSMSIPAPKEAVFLANSEHADPAHPDIITLVTAVTAVWKDSAGGAVTVTSMRRQKANHKRS